MNRQCSNALHIKNKTWFLLCKRGGRYCLLPPTKWKKVINETVTYKVHGNKWYGKTQHVQEKLTKLICLLVESIHKITYGGKKLFQLFSARVNHIHKYTILKSTYLQIHYTDNPSLLRLDADIFTSEKTFRAEMKER